MGGTTVSVDEMCSLYNSQGCTYPSEELSGGGASDIDTFCNIIVVQHLKAYASTDSLNQECVDERFDYVTRETAPYVEWLGIQENPYGGGWAAGKDYGSKLRKILADLKSGT